MSKPSIITEELIKDFCSKLRISGSIETAIKATGIGRETYYGWARAVNAGGGSALAKKLMRAVDIAEGEVKLLREHALSRHFDKHWQALAWYLERRFSQEYGQRRPPPLVDGSETEERRVERVVWAKAVPTKKEATIQQTPDAPPLDDSETPPIGEKGTGPDEGA